MNKQRKNKRSKKGMSERIRIDSINESKKWGASRVQVEWLLDILVVWILYLKIKMMDLIEEIESYSPQTGPAKIDVKIVG